MLILACSIPPSNAQPCLSLPVHFPSEKANLAITLGSTTSDKLLGHMAFFDYPSLPSLSQAHWEEALKEDYQLHKATVRYYNVFLYLLTPHLLTPSPLTSSLPHLHLTIISPTYLYLIHISTPHSR